MVSKNIQGMLMFTMFYIPWVIAFLLFVMANILEQSMILESDLIHFSV